MVKDDHEKTTPKTLGIQIPTSFSIIQPSDHLGAMEEEDIAEEVPQDEVRPAVGTWMKLACPHVILST